MELSESSRVYSTSSGIPIFQNKTSRGFSMMVFNAMRKTINGTGGMSIIYPMNNMMMMTTLDITMIKMTSHMDIPI